MHSAYWGHYLLHQINTDLLLEAKCRKPKGMDQLMKNEVIQNSRWLLEEFLWSERDTRVTPSGHDTACTHVSTEVDVSGSRSGPCVFSTRGSIGEH